MEIEPKMNQKRDLIYGGLWVEHFITYQIT